MLFPQRLSSTYRNRAETKLLTAHQLPWHLSFAQAVLESLLSLAASAEHLRSTLFHRNGFIGQAFFLKASLHQKAFISREKWRRLKFCNSPHKAERKTKFIPRATAKKHRALLRTCFGSRPCSHAQTRAHPSALWRKQHAHSKVPFWLEMIVSLSQQTAQFWKHAPGGRSNTG